MVVADPSQAPQRDDATSPFWAGAGSRMRLATEKPLLAMGLANPSGKLRVGRVAGLGGLLALLSAASELNDPNESAGRNLSQAGGSAVGGIGGGAAGAMIGSALMPGVGTLVGGALGGALGGSAGQGLGSLLADVVEGSPESRMLKNAEKAARQQMALDVERAQAMMPVQEMQLGMMQRQAEENAKIERSQMMQAALANALVEQQRQQAQQQAIATQAIFGGAG